MDYRTIEEERKKYKKKLTILLSTIFIITVVSIIIIIASAINGKKNIPEEIYGDVLKFKIITSIIQTIIIIAVISLPIVNIFTIKNRKKYTEKYKEYFVHNTLKKFFGDVNYNPSLGIDRTTVSKVLSTGDIFYSNDLIVAKYKNTFFQQSDIIIQEEQKDSDGNTSTFTTFLGRFLIFDFERNFSTNMILFTKNFTSARLSIPNGKKQTQIKTESTKFNKTFNFFAEDGIDALYIFDPSFMEKVQNLYDNLKKDFLLAFIDKKLYIAIKGKDSFEAPSVFEHLDETSEIEKVVKDIKVITNFVDNLNLDKYAKD